MIVVNVVPRLPSQGSVFFAKQFSFSFKVKMSVWEAGQRLKLEQTRWISNLLVYTGKTYIAVASQDKVCFLVVLSCFVRCW